MLIRVSLHPWIISCALFSALNYSILLHTDLKFYRKYHQVDSLQKMQSYRKQYGICSNEAESLGTDSLKEEILSFESIDSKNKQMNNGLNYLDMIRKCIYVSTFFLAYQNGNKNQLKIFYTPLLDEQPLSYQQNTVKISKISLSLLSIFFKSVF